MALWIPCFEIYLIRALRRKSKHNTQKEICYMKTLRNFKICRDNTSFPAARRALTSSRVNLAIDIDFTRCVNSRLQEHDLEHAYFFFFFRFISFRRFSGFTYWIPLQFVQMNVKKVVQTYCGPCNRKKHKMVRTIIHGI